ncbi:hypothetical protein FEK35_14365 [Nocardia cyriacigeorgica]|uniref:Uncharacterized protein n=1 Tax=Nocardia cyriacigeorgica TaxID=135487 RepID=A0A5R8PE74_9NOCA|nr:hypothetical protein [Nocardia cyriacigeorgica]TLG09810.1 hypothetical protein FEK35_14365 [Nocardia cyriacigeorgica]
MFTRIAPAHRTGPSTGGIAAVLRRGSAAWLLILGTIAALTMTGTVTAGAQPPPSSVDLQTTWEVHQRLSNTTDQPIGFRVKVTWRETNAADTIMSFNGFANTSTSWGEVVGGQIQGRLIRFTIHWSDGKTGVYQGSWFEDGHLRGSSREEGTGRTAEWWSKHNNWKLTPPPRR